MSGQAPGSRRLVWFPELVEDGQLDLSRLTEADVTFEPRYDLWNSPDEQAVAEALQGAWGVIAGGERISRTVLEAVPTLKVIVRPGLGYDTVDVDAATERGVLVLNTPGTIEPAVAELCVALILAVRRRLFDHDHAVRSGTWRPASFLVHGLGGSTVGLIGLGRIGREVVARLTGFGCRIVACDPAASPTEWADKGIDIVDLDELLAMSDVVTLHVPLTPDTRAMIGEAELRRMRPTAILVNTSRGEVVDEPALIQALRDGTIAGAGLDAFAQEPLEAGNPLAETPNVVLSGHVGWATFEGTRAMNQLALETAWRVASGEVPWNAINPEAAHPRASA